MPSPEYLTDKTSTITLVKVMVEAHTLGGRTVSAATRFMHKLARATDPAQKSQLTSDGLAAYPLAIGNVLGHQGERVGYAQLSGPLIDDDPFRQAFAERRRKHHLRTGRSLGDQIQHATLRETGGRQRESPFESVVTG